MLLAGNPLLPTMDEVRMIAAPSGQQRQRLLQREKQTLHVDAEYLLVEILGDIAQRRILCDAGIGEQDVEPALLLPYPGEQAIEIAELGHVARDAGYVLSDFLGCLVQLCRAARVIKT